MVDSLLQRKGHLSPLLQHSRASDLAAFLFAKFFTSKISTIYQVVYVIPDGFTQPSNDITDTHAEEMASLAATAEGEVRKIILIGPSKTCSFDLMPTSIVKDCLQELEPTITNIINCSMAEGVVPTTLKHANVVPVLKKPSLDKERMKNYRLVSNLTYLSMGAIFDSNLKPMSRTSALPHTFTSRISAKFAPTSYKLVFKKVNQSINQSIKLLWRQYPRQSQAQWCDSQISVQQQN